MFDDDNEEVRCLSARCFYNLSVEAFEESNTLIDSFVESKAFAQCSYSFFERLAQLPIQIPDVVCKAFERAVAGLRDLSANQSLGSGRFADMNTALLIRLSERTDNLDIKRRCLDIIDGLAESFVSHELDSMMKRSDS